MHTILLDPARYASSTDLHAALKGMLSLPSWYGGNADALNDCLSERGEPVSLWLASQSANEDTQRAVRLISRVVLDNGGSVREL